MMEENEMLEEFLKSISIVFYEALCCRIFLDIFLKHRFLFKLERFVSVVLLAGVFLLLALITQLNNEYIIRSMGIIVSIFLFSLLFLSGKWQKKLFLSLAFYALLCCVDYFSYITLESILGNTLLDNNVIQVMFVLLCKTILFVVILGIEHFWNRGRVVQMAEPAWILMICFPVLSMMIMIVMLLSFIGRNNSTGFLIVSFGIMVMNVVMFEWLKYVSEKDRRWNQIRLLQERNEEKIQLYHEMSLNYEEQKRILHDYHNQIDCMQGLLKKQQYKEAEAYAEKLADSFPDQMQNVDVNHPILNVVLNQKYRLAKRKDISFLFYANDLSDLWLEEQDAVSLLSNLLDNAIEACGKLESERKMWVKLVREKRQFVLSIRNTVSEPVDIQDDAIPTSKEDKRKHGIGLKNIQMILDKYQGMGMMRYEEGCFSYTAVIPEIKA
jgi:sensor histidine kinase YesM